MQITLWWYTNYLKIYIADWRTDPSFPMIPTWIMKIGQPPKSYSVLILSTVSGHICIFVTSVGIIIVKY
jgi:hypothetical protein